MKDIKLSLSTVLGLLGSLLLAANTYAAYMVHDFYLPLPEDQALRSFKSVAGRSASSVGSTLESITSIVITGPDTVVHYDHCEDGYEVVINNPVQATTQIWATATTRTASRRGTPRIRTVCLLAL